MVSKLNPKPKRHFWGDYSTFDLIDLHWPALTIRYIGKNWRFIVISRDLIDFWRFYCNKIGSFITRIVVIEVNDMTWDAKRRLLGSASFECQYPFNNNSLCNKPTSLSKCLEPSALYDSNEKIYGFHGLPIKNMWYFLIEKTQLIVMLWKVIELCINMWW